MKLRSTVLMLLLVTIGLGGCAATSYKRQVHNAQEVFISSKVVLIEARNAGRITEDDWHTYVLPAVRKGDAVLHVLRGRSVEVEGDVTSLEVLRDVIATLRPFIVTSTD